MPIDRNRLAAIHLRMQAESEARLKRKAAGIFRKQGREVARAYEAHGETNAIDVARKHERDWHRVLTAHYLITGKDFGKDTIRRIGDSQAKTFLDILLEWVRAEGLRKASGINQTTVEVIRGVISKGVSEGFGSKEIARNIRKKVSDEDVEYRSDLIARTETHNASTVGIMTGARSSGRPNDKEWVTIVDGRERESHREVDGQRKHLNQDFFVNGEFIDRPGEGSAENTINCRCTILIIPV